MELLRMVAEGIEMVGGSGDAVVEPVGRDPGNTPNSTGDDTFVGNPASIQISCANSAYSNKATGFPSVMAYSDGIGLDKAFFCDFNGASDTRAETDTFTTTIATGELAGPGYRLWARFFDEVHAEVKLGRDIANLSGTTGIDALYGTAAEVSPIVVPMSVVSLRCQTVRPDLTLRYVKDGHLNQTMGYLTACTFYAALFNRSPEGLPIDTVNENMRSKDGKPAQDPDGGPLKRTFSARDRADLQRIAWEGLKQFPQIAATTGHR